MKYAKLFTVLALALCLMVGLAGFAKGGTNLTVQFEKTPLFNEANILPGDGTTRFIKATNNTTAANKIAVVAENFPNPAPSDDLSRALDMKISKGGVDIWGGSSSTGKKTLFDFYQAGEITLSDIAAGQTLQFDFTLSLSTDKGDLPVSPTTWQAKKTNFDIAIGFTGEINPPCTGPNCPCVGPSCHSDPPCVGPNCGGGCVGPSCGGNGGGCTIWIIESPVTSVKAQNVQQKSAQIIWDTNCKGDSQVMYSPEGDSHNYDDSKPHKGYTFESLKKTDYVFSHSIDLNNLTACTKYYFRVFSGNPKIAMSREYDFVTPGCVNGTSTVTTTDYRNFGEPDIVKSTPMVAGASSTCACPDSKCDCKEEEPVKSVLGAFGVNASACGTYDDIPWILAVLMLCLCLYEKNRKDMLRKKIKQAGYVLTENDRKFNGKIFFKSIIFPLIIIIILLLLQWICPDIIMLWWFWVIMITLLCVWTNWHYQRKNLQKIWKGLQEIKTTIYQA